MTVAHAGITQGLFSEEVAVLFRGEGVDLAAPEGEFPSPAGHLVRPDRESKRDTQPKDRVPILLWRIRMLPLEREYFFHCSDRFGMVLS